MYSHRVNLKMLALQVHTCMYSTYKLHCFRILPILSRLRQIFKLQTVSDKYYLYIHV